MWVIGGYGEEHPCGCVRWILGSIHVDEGDRYREGVNIQMVDLDGRRH